MSGKRSRSKGARGERELAAFLRQYGLTAERTAQRCGKGGTADVRVKELPWLHLECKRTERLNIYDALSQAAQDAGPGGRPVVAHRRNGRTWVAILRMEDLIDMARAYHRRGVTDGGHGDSIA